MICIHFRYKPLIGYIIWKYILRFGRLSFCSVDFLHCAKAFYFDVMTFVYYCSVALAPGRYTQKNTSKSDVKVFTACFLLEVLRCLVLHLTPGFIWVYFCIWCKKVVEFHILHVSVQFFKHHLLKRLSFPHCILLPPLP